MYQLFKLASFKEYSPAWYSAAPAFQADAQLRAGIIADEFRRPVGVNAPLEHTGGYCDRIKADD